MKLGLDEGDFLAAIAPRPVVVLAQELDNFDVRGSFETLARLKRLYTLLGHPENISIHVGPEGHGFHPGARQVMYDCFNKATGRKPIAAEPLVTLEQERDLLCTNSGQVVELQNRPVYEFTKEKARRLAADRPQLSGKPLADAVVDVLRLPARSDAPGYRILRPRKSRNYPLPWTSIYNVETEPGILAIVYRLSQEAHHSRPPQEPGPAILYVAHDSSDVELRGEPLVAEVLAAEPQARLYTADVRGLGESRPNTCGENSYHSRYGCDFMYASYALMLDRPYIGGRTHDILSVLDWIKSFGHTSVHLVAKGYGAIPGAYAALLHDSVVKVTLKHSLTSYADVASCDVYQWPPSSFTFGVLEKFDLPDLYRELAAKKLRQIEPRGPEKARI
jgi:hypothetical protein